MMNCKVFKRESWYNFKALFWHSPRGTEGKHENPQSGHTAGLRAEI
jgi:hypothetical protein